MRKRDRAPRPWHLYVLGLAAIAVAVLAIVEIGPPSSSAARTAHETVTAANGVVQSSVTGTGNLEPESDVNVNFASSGTLQEVYVSVGQHVTQGQLLAQLDPTSAQLSLDSANASLTAAEDNLTEVEDGTSSGSTGAGSTGNSGAANTSYTTSGSPSLEFASYKRGGNADVNSGPSTTPSRSSTTPSRSSTTPSHTTSSGSRASGSSGSGSSSSGSSGTKTSTTPSPSSIASAQASIYTAEANVRTAQQAVNNTKLYAPVSGTIVSLASISPGDSVSSGATGTASSSSSSTGSSGTSGSSALAGAGSSAGSLGGSASSSSSSTGSSSSGSSSSSTPFAQIVDSGTMTMTVPLSESDISNVHVGQSATITPDALSNVQLGAQVTQIATVGTNSDGVVSYDTTLTLNQSDSQVRPGMSASASIIVKQAQGVTLPNQAVTSGTGSLGTVSLLRNGKAVQQRVIVGLKGDSRTQIVSGLDAGQQVQVTISLPSVSESTSTSSSSGTLGGGTGRFGGGGGFFGGGGGGFAGAGGLSRGFPGGGG
jgi:multidrug efflux pump subunit AcrA (membrane-fusion protein)